MNDTHDGAQVVITTQSFRRGQEAARKDFAKDPAAMPNQDILDRLTDVEFAAGYRDEWVNFLAPTYSPEVDVDDECDFDPDWDADRYYADKYGRD